MPYEEEDTCQQRDESMSHTMLLGACSVKCLGFQGVGGVLHDRTHGPVTNSRPFPRRNAHPISSPPPAPSHRRWSTGPNISAARAGGHSLLGAPLAGHAVESCVLSAQPMSYEEEDTCQQCDESMSAQPNPKPNTRHLA
jgi:hypothetical protein